MNNWKTVRLGDIGRIVTGKTPKTICDDNYGGEILFLTPSDDMTAKYCYSTKRMLSNKGANEVKNCLIPANSICVSCIGSDLGKVIKTTTETVTNQQINSIVVDDKYNSDFIYYAMIIIGRQLNFISKTSTAVPIVNKTAFSNYYISLPGIEEQGRIAGILGALDDKIECNNRINRNLEEQAAALFRRWFVDFEFPDPDPTSPTYGKPYRSAGGTMQGSPLGSIPKGWKVGTFRDIISSTIGGDWGKESAEANYSQKVYCIRGADITDVSKGEKGKMPLRYILPKNHIAKKLEVNDLVIEISGGSPTQSTGRIAIISDSLLKRYDEDMICTNFCRAIKSKKEYAQFIYSLWRYMYDQNIMFSYENGTTGIKNLNINGLIDNEQIIIPPIEVLNSYNNLQEQFFNTIFTNALECETLATVRDTLLPKLMNSDVKI